MPFFCGVNDSRNRPTEIETIDGGIQKNRYDGEGLRAELEENGELIRFLYSGRDVVAEQDGKNNPIRYVRGLELLSSDCECARTYYHYASDELGSIAHVTDENGTVLNRYSYDAFGNRTVKEETVPNRFGFTGEICDGLTGQYYLRARFYNPVIGRFLNEDTYYGDGLNLYSYCRNNPVRYVDPSGHSCEGKEGRRTLEGGSEAGDTRGILSDYLNVTEENVNEFFYSVKNASGADVYVSVNEITPENFQDIIANTKGKIEILSGIHGDELGNIIIDEELFFYDVTHFMGENVSVYNFGSMTADEISKIINSSNSTVCAWCFSEMNPLVRMALKRGY